MLGTRINIKMIRMIMHISNQEVIIHHQFLLLLRTIQICNPFSLDKVKRLHASLIKLTTELTINMEDQMKNQAGNHSHKLQG